MALMLNTLGDVMTILGATTNSGIGFLIPIIFYLKIEEKSSKWSLNKIAAYFTFVAICLCSGIELYSFYLTHSHK